MRVCVCMAWGCHNITMTTPHTTSPLLLSPDYPTPATSTAPHPMSIDISKALRGTACKKKKTGEKRNGASPQLLGKRTHTRVLLIDKSGQDFFNTSCSNFQDNECLTQYIKVTEIRLKDYILEVTHWINSKFCVSFVFIVLYVWIMSS